jgi:hypothetical protein
MRQVMRHGVWAAMSKAWYVVCVCAQALLHTHTSLHVCVRSNQSTYPCIRRARPWQHVERAGGCGARTRWRPYGMTSRLVRGGRGILCMGRPVPVVAPGINPTQACPASSAVQCRALHAVIGAHVVVASLPRATPAPRHGSLTLSVRSCPGFDPVSRAHAQPSRGQLHHTHVCIARWPAEH